MSRARKSQSNARRRQNARWSKSAGRKEALDRQRTTQKLMRCREWPIRECVINASWSDAMMASILICRDRPEGEFAAAVFLVDLGCLGVKEADAWSSLSWGAYQQLRNGIGGEASGEPVSIPAADALKIITEAQAWADSLGFKAPGTLPMARLLFKGHQADESALEVHCGLDGKAHYIPGPDDDAGPIIAHLTARLGPDGFTTEGAEPS